MAPQPPPGVVRDRVTRVQLWEVPIEIDGRPSVITGYLDWLPSVSPMPWLAMTVLTFAALEMIRRRSPVGPFLALGTGGLIAAVVGVSQLWSSPYGVVGELMAWLPPALAVVTALLGLHRVVFHSNIVYVIGAVPLATWVVLRFPTFWMPVLPTDLPTDVERAALALATGAVAAALFAVVARTLSLALPGQATLLPIVLALVWALPSGASAHTEPDLVAVPAGATTTVTFRPTHGCGASPTIEVAVRAPVDGAVAEPVEGWEVSAAAEGEGNTILTWSGGLLPADQVGEFPITFSVPDAVGELLLFPAVQECENGEELAWISGDPESEFPAPRLLVLPEDHPPAATIDQVAPDAPGRQLLVEVVDTDHPAATTVPTTTTTTQATTTTLGTTTTAPATTTTTIAEALADDEAGGGLPWVILVVAAAVLAGLGLMRRLRS